MTTPTLAIWSPAVSFARYYLRYSACEKKLSVRERQLIVDQLDESVPSSGVREYFVRQPNFFQDLNQLVVAFENETDHAVGLLGGRNLEAAGTRILYVWTILVGERYRGTDIFNQMISLFFRRVSESARGLPGVVAAKTFNPIILSTMRNVAKSLDGVEFYPNINQTQQAPDMVHLARQIAPLVAPGLELNVETGVIAGALSAIAGNFYKENPRSRESDVQEYLDANVTAADQVLCIWTISDLAKDHFVRLWHQKTK
jgi:hypothetical protein